MKKPILTTIIGIALCISASAQNTIKQREDRAQKVNAYYQQASQAYKDGDITSASEALKNALALNPRHAQSYALSLQLKKQGSTFKAKARERQLAQIKLKHIDVEDMELGEALEILSKLIEKETKDKYIPNFVIQDSSGILKTKKVKLNLKGIPASIALEYLLEQTGAISRFDDYAINIRSRRPLKSEDGPKKNGFGE